MRRQGIDPRQIGVAGRGDHGAEAIAARRRQQGRVSAVTVSDQGHAGRVDRRLSRRLVDDGVDPSGQIVEAGCAADGVRQGRDQHGVAVGS